MYNIFVRKLQGNRPTERRCLGWEDNIKMDVKEITCENVDKIHQAQDVTSVATS
jgi:hypothetical protein